MKMRIQKILILTAFALLISSCASRISLPDYANEVLIENEGLLLVYVHNPNEKLKFFFKGKKHSIETPVFGKGSSVRLLKVPADHYEMSMAYVGALRLVFEDYLQVEVRPGHVTYPGDFIMNGYTLTTSVLVDDVLSDFPKRYPEVADQFQLLIGSELIENRRQIYDGVRSARKTSTRSTNK